MGVCLPKIPFMKKVNGIVFSRYPIYSSSVKLANFSRRMFSFVAILRRKKRDGGGTPVFVHDQRVLLG